MQWSATDLSQELTVTRFDNELWTVAIKDIILQPNYHSIHHRAQMQLLMRQQAVAPYLVDYIFSKYKRKTT